MTTEVQHLSQKETELTTEPSQIGVLQQLLGVSISSKSERCVLIEKPMHMVQERGQNLDY